MNKKSNYIFSKKGFTLVELLIVMTIISVLSSAAVPTYSNIQNRAKESATKVEMQNIVTAIELYGADNNTYPSSSDIEELGDELEGYIVEMSIADAWGLNYRYNFSSERYTLASSGIDKTFDTEDDISFSNGMMVSDGNNGGSGQGGSGDETTALVQTTTTTEVTITTEEATTTTEESTTTTIDEPSTTLPDYPLWSAGSSYMGGTYVTYDEKVFLARNWTQNEEPGLINSPWQEVTDEWRSFNVYNKDDLVIYEGIEYIAKRYSQNSPPDSSSAWKLAN